MNETSKTIAFIAAALLLGGAAAARLTTKAPTGAFFEQGGAFFPEFKDPSTAASMEVIAYDPSTASPSQFKVMLKGNRWTIPSHHDYPADAKDRLKNTSTGFIDLTKDAIRSTLRDDHKALGVLDPLDPKVAGSEGLGKRVILRDKSDKVLADFIIGKDVPGHPEQRYVRVPSQNQTYAVNFQKEKDKVDLSTRFSDWIETNLLKLDASHVRRIVFDNHKVDPEQGIIRPGDHLTVERKDASGPWTMIPAVDPDEEVNAEKLTGLTTALADLKIAGVRPKPPGLTAELKATGEIAATKTAIQSLASKGFYMMRNGDLVSNQGDVRVITDEGVVYVLRFGEVTFASGEDLTAGSKESGKEKEKGGEKKSEGGVESRYLLVTAEFDPAFVPEPVQEPPAPAPKALPKDVFMPEPGTAERAEMDKKAQEKADREQAERDRKLEEGRKRAKELSDRFAAWYYVVPGDNFRDIVLDRAALVRKKSDKPATPPPSFPGFPGGDDGVGAGFGAPGGRKPIRLPAGHP